MLHPIIKAVNPGFLLSMMNNYTMPLRQRRIFDGVVPCLEDIATTSAKLHASVITGEFEQNGRY